MGKTNFYDEISGNKFKSSLLIGIVLVFIILFGYFIGWLYGSPIFGLIFSGFIAVIYILIGYYSGANIILKASGAKEVEKKDYPYLHNTVHGLSIAACIPTPKIYIIQEDSPNAFATGRDYKNSSVTVTTGLLNLMNRQELEGVLAHEISHIKNYDVKIMMLTTVLVGSLVLISGIFFRMSLFGGNDRKGNGHVIILLIALALAILTPIIGELIKLGVSRKREYLADANGALLTRYPQGLANALKKIARDPEPGIPGVNKATANLWIENPLRGQKGIMNNLFSSHPPLEDRISKLEGM